MSAIAQLIDQSSTEQVARRQKAIVAVQGALAASEEEMVAFGRDTNARATKIGSGARGCSDDARVTASKYRSAAEHSMQVC
jgi:hypothetical protein